MNPRTVEAAIPGAAARAGSAAAASPITSTTATGTYHRTRVDGVEVFYREAGQQGAPTIVLLDGFPSSSRQFDTLIPLLAMRNQLIAQDFPGFSQSDAPPLSAYTYTFDHLTQTTDDLLDALKIERYNLYIHDYDAPVGMRLILAHPERLQVLIIQNGNLYEAGIGAKWSKIAQYWADPPAYPEVIDVFLPPEATDRAIPWTPRARSAAIPTPGRTKSCICPSQVSARFRRRRSTTTGPMSSPISPGRRGSGSTSPRPWWHGVPMIRPSLRRARRPSAPTCRMRRSICWTPVISRSTKITTRPPR